LSSEEYPSATRARYTLGVLMVAYVLAFVDRQMLNLLVGPIRHDLGIRDFQMSLLQGMAFALFYTTLGLPIGRLADHHNRTRIIVVGVTLWSLMTAACGLAKSFATLFLARVGVGVGEAALSPAAYSIFSDSFHPTRLPRANGIYAMGVTIGSGLAYVVGGAVIDLVSRAPSTSLPFIGPLKPWQLTFLLVGLSGLAVSLLLLTLKEPGRRGVKFDHESTEAARLGMGGVLRFLVTRWRSYAPIYVSVSLIGVLANGYMNWYPTFLIRTFHWPVRDVGLYFGLMYLTCGSAGALGGALLSEQLSRRGYRDANLRVVVLVAAALLVPAAMGPLMPTGVLALAVAAPTIFLLNAHIGVSIAALQLVTPNQMRAFTTATFLLTTTLVGTAVGTSCVALLTDYVFANDFSLRYSLAVIAVVVCPLAAVVCGRGLKHYGLAMQESSAGGLTAIAGKSISLSA
jgi:MFS family permease